MRRIAVGDVMTKNFVSVDYNTNLLKCAKELVKKRVSGLLLTDKKTLKGILTSTDILWAITKKSNIDLKEVKAMDIATRKVAVIKPSADIDQALKKMKALNFRRLPVLLRGKLIGVITLKDILRIEPSLYTETGEFFQVREEQRKLRETKEKWPLEGFCDNCGAFSSLLKVSGKLLCPDCREELF